MIKKSFIAFSIIFLAMLESVFAESVLTVQYHADSEKITIQGAFDNVYNVTAGMMIIPEDVKRESLTAENISINKYLMSTVDVDKNGNFLKSVIMPVSTQSGRYIIYLNNGELCLQEKILYINKTEAEAVVSELCNKSGQNFSDYYEDNIEKLGITKDEFELYKESITSIMMLRKTKDLNAFLQEQNRILALCKIVYEDDDDAVLKYESYFDVDYHSEYKSLSDNIKEYFVQNVKSEDWINTKSKDVFWNSYIMAHIKGINNYLELQNTILSFKERLDVDFTKYNTLSDYYKSLVFSDMYNQNIEKYSQISTAFETSVTNTINKMKNDNIVPGGSGSSSGFGGGSGGSSGFGGGSASSYTNEFSIAPSVNSKVKKFTDVYGHWAEKSIFNLCECGIVSGFDDNTFRPENFVTRAEFIKLLVYALNISTKSDNGFNDVGVNDWYYDVISAANSAGLIYGANGMFYPNENISRQDVAVIIYRALKQKGVSFEQKINFYDENEIFDYAKEAVANLGASNVIQGYNGNFNPKDNTTRAEATVLIERIIKILEG